MTIFTLIIYFIVGISIGSFINVVSYRLPFIIEDNQYKSVVNLYQNLQHKFNHVNLYSRSKCPHCNSPIPYKYNIPVLGYFLTKRKCFNCSSPISIKYPIIELVTGLYFVFCAHYFTFSFQILYISLFSILIIIALIDLDYLIIPNQLLLTLIFIGVFINKYIPQTSDPLFNYIEAISFYFSLFMIIKLVSIYFKKTMIGLGDIKLISVLIMILGFKETMNLLFMSVVIAGIIFCILALMGKKIRSYKLPLGPCILFAYMIFSINLALQMN